LQLEGDEWPFFGWTSDVRDSLFAAAEVGRAVVLGTLVHVNGGAPRQIGTQMLFDGNVATGYFTGGCLESDIANHAQSVLQDENPRELLYGIGSPWIDIQLTCGGSLTIMLERIAPNDAAVAQLRTFSENRQPAIWFSDGCRRVVLETSDLGCRDARQWARFSRLHLPRWRLVLAGGSPTVLAIAKLASEAGWEPWILRPGGPATAPPIERLRYMRTDIKASLTSLKIDPWTAVISAAHDDDIDDEVTVSGLCNNAPYIGILGASSRVTTRIERLRKRGIVFAPKDIRSPIGLPHCGKAPWEVAVSVIAELLQLRENMQNAEDV